MRRNLLVATAVILICAAATNASPNDPPKFQFNNEAFLHRVQEQLLRSISSMPLPKMRQADMSVEPRHSRWERSFRNEYWGGCGWGTASKFDFEHRLTKLPDDPTLILGAGYLKCQRIDIAILEPRVPVTSYPAGHFGDYVYQNVLIAERVEFSDEATLRQLFLLVVAAASAVDDVWPFWLEDPAPNMNVSDFREVTGFIPELLVEFVGETKLRVEMNLTTRRVLILSGDRWEAYELNSGSAAAIETIAIAARAKLQQSRE